MKIKRPMKSADFDEDKIIFPAMVSPKLDGFRVLKLDGKALSSSFKPIRNKYTRETIEKYFPDNIDGELMLEDPNATFNQISSAFSSINGEPRFVFFSFDYVMKGPFLERYNKVKEVVQTTNHTNLKYVPHTAIFTMQELYKQEDKYLELGYEGLMIRSMFGPYKSGRATAKEGHLFKLKRFVDSEARIIGFVEQMNNQNEAKTNELGLVQRSTAKDAMIPAGTLGKFIVIDIYSGVQFEIGVGAGLTADLRALIWSSQPEYMGKLIKYKYQAIGTKDKPRLPVFLGFRSEDDLSI